MATTKRPHKKQTPPPKPMPATTLSPLSSRKRRKQIEARVCAAVSMPEHLYLAGLKRAKVKAGNNWSAYVRDLISDDLSSSAV